MHVIRARHARQVALHLGVEIQVVGPVRVALLPGVSRVGNLAAFDDAQAGRNRTHGAQGHDRLGRHRDERAGAKLQGRARRVGLDVPVGGIHHLPDAVEVGVLAVGAAGRPIRRRRSLGGRRLRGRLHLRHSRTGHREAGHSQSRHNPHHALIPPTRPPGFGEALIASKPKQRSCAAPDMARHFEKLVG